MRSRRLSLYSVRLLSTAATLFFCQLLLTACGSLGADKYGNSVATGTLNPGKIKIINHINKCINISPLSIKQKDFGMFLLTKTRFNKTTAYCGCKSRLLSYTVKEIPNIKGREVKLERMRGLKNTREAKDKVLEFIISTDKDISYTGDLEIEISCSPPD